MAGREAAEVVLNLVQMLDQQVGAPGLVAQQVADLLPRRGINLPALFGIARLAPPATGVSGFLISAPKKPPAVSDDADSPKSRFAQIGEQCDQWAPMRNT